MLAAAAVANGAHQLAAANVTSASVPPDGSDPLYERLRSEAVSASSSEPAMSCLLSRTVLHPSVTSFESAVATVVAHRLALSCGPNPDVCPNLLRNLYEEALLDPDAIEAGHTASDAVRADALAHVERDPACDTVLEAVLFYKGYAAVVSHRVARRLWYQSRSRFSALWIQSQASAAFGVDIHPAATVGSGIMFDHATGVVVGETAHLGDGCTLLHGVTLGGTGKDVGDRHPKVGRDVLIGANASVLGNIRIGDGAKIGAGSVVLRPVPHGATAVGAPAKIIGWAKEKEPGKNVDCGLLDVVVQGGGGSGGGGGGGSVKKAREATTSTATRSMRTDSTMSLSTDGSARSLLLDEDEDDEGDAETESESTESEAGSEEKSAAAVSPEATEKRVERSTVLGSQERSANAEETTFASAAVGAAGGDVKTIPDEGSDGVSAHSGSKLIALGLDTDSDLPDGEAQGDGIKSDAKHKGETVTAEAEEALAPAPAVETTSTTTTAEEADGDRRDADVVSPLRAPPLPSAAATMHVVPRPLPPGRRVRSSSYPTESAEATVKGGTILATRHDGGERRKGEETATKKASAAVAATTATTYTTMKTHRGGRRHRSRSMTWDDLRNVAPATDDDDWCSPFRDFLSRHPVPPGCVTYCSLRSALRSLRAKTMNEGNGDDDHDANGGACPKVTDDEVGEVFFELLRRTGHPERGYVPRRTFRECFVDVAATFTGLDEGRCRRLLDMLEQIERERDSLAGGAGAGSGGCRKGRKTGVKEGGGKAMGASAASVALVV